MSYLCNLFAIIIFIFITTMYSHNFINTGKLVFWACLSKAQPQVVTQHLLNFF